MESGAANSTPFVQVLDAQKSYGQGAAQVQVLRKLSLEVEQGQICAILGASGSGKSTLLNVIGGLDTLDAGSIHVAGTEISALSPKELGEYRRNSLGFIFQQYNLIANLTVRENIEVCAHLSSAPLPMQDLLATLGLEALGDRFPAQLSGGQQQRCAIGRALIKNPTLLLCDEPTGALDSNTAREILELLEQINEQFGTTMLMVTHNEGICPMVDKVVHIRDGQITREQINSSKTPAAQIEL